MDFTKERNFEKLRSEYTKNDDNKKKKENEVREALSTNFVLKSVSYFCLLFITNFEKMSSGFLFVLLFFVSFFSVVQSQSPDPSEVYVQSISYGGNGCPQGSVGSSFSNDRKSFTLIFDQFVASMGPGVPIVESRKNCRLNLNLHVPSGWSFELVQTENRGFVLLPAGAKGRLDIDFDSNLISNLHNNSPFVQKGMHKTYAGPVSQDYLATTNKRGFRPLCSNEAQIINLAVDAQVRVWSTDGSSIPAQMTVDSIDGESGSNIMLKWHRCVPEKALPPPNEVYVQSVTYGGSGCPQGSVSSTFSNDRTYFSLTFDQYIASSGTGVPVTESRKNCQVNINLRVPYGWTFDLSKHSSDGFVQLPKRVSAEAKTVFYFQGEAFQTASRTLWKGPVNKNYESDNLLSSTLYSPRPCGQIVPINLNNQVRLMNFTGQAAQITVTSLSNVRLQWRRVTGQPRPIVLSSIDLDDSSSGSDSSDNYWC
jgi:hypothetical protein